MSHQSGFSLLELVIVFIILGILLGMALERFLPYIEEAERVSVIRVEGQLRSTLMMEAAERVARGQSVTVTDLNGANPVNFLVEPPTNYTGEVESAPPDGAEPRHWYFDTSRRELVYQPGTMFRHSDDRELRENPAFSVRVAYDDRDGDGRFEASRDELYGVRLVRVAGSQWLASAALD